MKKLILLLTLITFTSCTNRDRERPLDKRAITAINHSEPDIVIEILHNGEIPYGINKIFIDTTEYILIRDRFGIGIIKHN